MTTSTKCAHAVLRGLDGIRDWQEAFYRDLHQHPELSHQEFRTAGKVAERLDGCGYQLHTGIGGTGVVGVYANGLGPAVLLRADMDALPVAEDTGLGYSSSALAADADGNEVPVMHDDGLATRLPTVDVALAQHVLPAPAGVVGTRIGPSAADSVRITVFGRGAHGSMPQAAVDPVVLAAMIVVRLQTVVSQEITPAETAVLTVGSISAGSKSNVIPDRAVLQLNIRTYSKETRTRMLGAIRRIVVAECQASNSPKEPTFELFDRQRRRHHISGKQRVRGIFRGPLPGPAAAVGWAVTAMPLPVGARLPVRSS
jgi:hippurate hydrolase